MRLLLAFCSGALAALGHAPFSLWPIAFLGLVALIGLVASATAPGRVAWAAGSGYFAVALHWIVEPFLIDAATHGWMAPFALVLMAAGLGLFWGAAGWLAARIGGNRALAFAVTLSLAELARGYILTGFPWALPGYIWTGLGPMALAALVGPFGLTALTLLAAALPVSARDRRAQVTLGTVAIAGLALTFGAGAVRIAAEPVGGGETIRLVQPNVPQDEKWDAEKAPEFVNRLLTSTSAEGDPDLIVWPESAVAYPLDLAAPILDRAADLSNGAPVITGINRRTEDGRWFNAIVSVGQGGAVTDTYDKVHLVPFGEYIPGRIDLLRRMAAFTGFGFTPGEAVRLIDTPAGEALPLICYEAIFPRHGGSLDSRPDYLLQLTNDAWFGTFAGPYQHLQQAQFRAVEMGVPLVRAANTGVSALIDSHGRVLQTLELGEAGLLDVELPGRLPTTLYFRTGDLPTLVLLVVAAGALFAAGRRNPIAKRSATS